MPGSGLVLDSLGPALEVGGGRAARHLNRESVRGSRLAGSQVLFQTARFAILVPKSLKISWLHASRVTAVGQVLNVAVPARGGDLYKAFALCPGQEGARTRALGVVAADKAADVLGLTVVALSLGLGSAFQWFGVLQKNGARLVLVLVAGHCNCPRF